MDRYNAGYKERYILALDQGTTSSRAILFDKEGLPIASSQKEFKQYFPKPGWVEHDAGEIWQTQLETAREAIARAGIDVGQIEAIGITNQRETTVLWERDTGKPLYHAIVWQCRRTADICEILKGEGLTEIFHRKTGLLLDPYFSGTKVKWLLDNVEGIREKAEKGKVLFGTIDSWLIYNLTGSHMTDPSNASRTLLYNIQEGKWDNELLDILDVPSSILPEVGRSSGNFGVTKKELFGREIPVTGIAGDQQAALFGQACFEEGMVKVTYGTGSFTLLNTGSTPVFSRSNLLTTVAWDTGNGLEYAIEGSVFIAGAVVQWLRDQLGIIEKASDTEKMALSVDDTAGVYFVPAFVGLGAPHWDSSVRGTIVGITRGTTRNHLVRAALESIAFQNADLITTMKSDLGNEIKLLKADGGASLNNFLMQFQADILDTTVVVPSVNETTALGAAYLAGLGTGFWNDRNELAKKWKARATFKSSMKEETRTGLIKNWQKALKTAKSFR